MSNGANATATKESAPRWEALNSWTLIYPACPSSLTEATLIHGGGCAYEFLVYLDNGELKRARFQCASDEWARKNALDAVEVISQRIRDDEPWDLNDLINGHMPRALSVSAETRASKESEAKSDRIPRAFAARGGLRTYFSYSIPGHCSPRMFRSFCRSALGVAQDAAAHFAAHGGSGAVWPVTIVLTDDMANWLGDFEVSKQRTFTAR